MEMEKINDIIRAGNDMIERYYTQSIATEETNPKLSKMSMARAKAIKEYLEYIMDVIE